MNTISIWKYCSINHVFLDIPTTILWATENNYIKYYTLYLYRFQQHNPTSQKKQSILIHHYYFNRQLKSQLHPQKYHQVISLKYNITIKEQFVYIYN
jgi:hypothetical protein